jgi:hypothetical protein
VNWNPYRTAFFVGFALVQAAGMLTGGRLVCQIAGHDPQWWYGVSVLDHDGPACARCGKLL